MKKFNINDYIYIQINERGWYHLITTVGEDYIKHCIKVPSYEKLIDGEIWYRLQCHQVFDILPIQPGSFDQLFNTNILIENAHLTSYPKE